MYDKRKNPFIHLAQSAAWRGMLAAAAAEAVDGRVPVLLVCACPINGALHMQWSPEFADDPDKVAFLSGVAEYAKRNGPGRPEPVRKPENN